MDDFIIPQDKLQATIHLQGRGAGLNQLLGEINEHKYTNISDIKGAIHKQLDLIKEILYED